MRSRRGGAGLTVDGADPLGASSSAARPAGPSASAPARTAGCTRPTPRSLPCRRTELEPGPCTADPESERTCSAPAPARRPRLSRPDRCAPCAPCARDTAPREVPGRPRWKVETQAGGGGGAGAPARGVRSRGRDGGGVRPGRPAALRGGVAHPPACARPLRERCRRPRAHGHGAPGTAGRGAGRALPLRPPRCARAPSLRAAAAARRAPRSPRRDRWELGARRREGGKVLPSASPRDEAQGKH